MIKKLCAIITVLCFAHASFGAPCVQGALELAAQIQAVGAVVASAGASDDPFNLRLPPTLGRVTGGNNTGHGPIVINIQDLHCHAEVQRNISSILQFLDANYGLRDVYVEGGYGRLNTAWLDRIADPGLRKKMVNALLENGRLGGSEYYAITSGRHDLLTGLEDERLHKANIVRLGTILDRQPRFEAKLRELRRDLVVMKARYLSAENKRLDNILAKYRAGEMTDARLYALLSAYIDKINARPDAYHSLQVLRKESFPTIQLYRQTMALQKRLRYSKVSAQLTACMGTLKTRLSFAAYNDLLTSTNNLSDLDALAPALARLPRGHQINIGARYPDLARFIAYREKSRAVNPMVLMRETRRMTDALRSAFARNSAERDIAFLCDIFDCFEDYLLNRLTAEDYAYFKPRFARFVSEWGAYTYTNRIRDLAPDFPLLDAYYAANERRNGVFIDTMAPSLRQCATSPKAASAPDIIVMVSGGFHTDGIARLLTERGISYCTVTPSVTRPAAAARQVFEQTIRYQSRLFGAQALNATPLEALHPVVHVSPDGLVTVSLDGGARFIVDGDAFTVEGDIAASAAAAAARGLDFAAVQRNAGIIVRLLLTRQTPLSLIPALYELVNICGDMLARKGTAGTGLLWDIAANPAVQKALADNGIPLDSISTWLEPLQTLAAGYAVTQAAMRDLRDDPSTNSVVRAVLSVPYIIETLGAIHVFHGSAGTDAYDNLGEAVDRLVRMRDSGHEGVDSVAYTAVLDADGNARFTGERWPEDEETIFLFNPARAGRVGTISQPSHVMDPAAIEAKPSVHMLKPSAQAGSPVVRWLSKDRTPWYVKPNEKPHWRRTANYLVLARADTGSDGAAGSLGQAEMSSLQNIRDVLEFQYALNASLPADAPRYTAGVNGWFYDRVIGAIRGGSTQNWPHAQLFRLFMPIATAATRRIGTAAGGVDVNVLSGVGMVSAVVLEADAEHREALAAAIYKLLSTITNEGHSFNYLVIPSGKRLRVFVFDRVLTRLPGFDDEAGFSQMAGMISFADPAKFFAVDPGEHIDRDDLVTWARTRVRLANGSPRLNVAFFKNARNNLPQLTAPRDEVERLARTILVSENPDTGVPDTRAGQAGTALTLPSTYRLAAWIAGKLHRPFARGLPEDWYAPENRADHLKMAWFAERVAAPLAVWDLPAHLAVSLGNIVRGRDVRRNLIRTLGAAVILSATAGIILLAGGFVPMHAWTDILPSAAGLLAYAGLHSVYNRLFGTGTGTNAPLTVGAGGGTEQSERERAEESSRSLVIDALSRPDVSEADARGDAVMICGNENIATFEKALDLYADGKVGKIIISGARGRLTELLIEQAQALARERGYRIDLKDPATITEAEIIRDILIGMAAEHGESLAHLERDIILENASTNTRENFERVRGLLKQHPDIKTIVYIQTPIQQLRTKGTFNKVFRQEITEGTIRGISFTIPIERVTTQAILEELWRIVVYTAKGDLVLRAGGVRGLQAIPEAVWQAADALLQARAGDPALRKGLQVLREGINRDGVSWFPTERSFFVALGLTPGANDARSQVAARMYALARTSPDAPDDDQRAIGIIERHYGVTVINSKRLAGGTRASARPLLIQASDGKKYVFKIVDTHPEMSRAETVASQIFLRKQGVPVPVVKKKISSQARNAGGAYINLADGAGYVLEEFVSGPEASPAGDVAKMVDESECAPFLHSYGMYDIGGHMIDGSQDVIAILNTVSKGVMTMRDFLQHHGGDTAGGYALGLTHSHGIYQVLSKFFGLATWETGYKELKVDGVGVDHIQRYMEALTSQGKPVVFFVPSRIKSTYGFITQAELKWMAQNPDKLKNVYFVFGAYDHYFPEGMAGTSAASINAMFTHVREDVLNVTEADARAGVEETIARNYRDAEARAERVGEINTLPDDVQIRRFTELLASLKGEITDWQARRGQTSIASADEDLSALKQKYAEVTALVQRMRQLARHTYMSDVPSISIDAVWYDPAYRAIIDDAIASVSSVEPGRAAEDARPGTALTLPSTYRLAAWVAGILHRPFAQSLPQDWYAPEHRARYPEMARFAERVVAPLAVWDLPAHLIRSLGDIVHDRDVKKNLIRTAGAAVILSATAGLILLVGGFVPIHAWADMLPYAAGLLPYIGLHAGYNRLFGTGTKINAPLTLSGGRNFEGSRVAGRALIPQSVRLLSEMPAPTVTREMQLKNAPANTLQALGTHRPSMRERVSNAGPAHDNAVAAAQELMMKYRFLLSSDPSGALSMFNRIAQESPRLGFLLKYQFAWLNGSFISVMLSVPDDEITRYEKMSGQLAEAFMKASAGAVSRVDFPKEYMPAALVMEAVLPGSMEHMIGILNATGNPSTVIRFLESKRAALSDIAVIILLAQAYRHILNTVDRHRDPRSRKLIKLNHASFYGIINIASCLREANAVSSLAQVVNMFPSTLPEADSADAVIVQMHDQLMNATLHELQHLSGAAQVSAPARARLHAPFIDRLFVAHRTIDEDYREELPWFLGVIRSMLENRFWDFLENTRQNDPVGREIAEHNARIRADMATLHIDADRFLGRPDGPRCPPGSFSYGGKTFTLRPILRDPGHDLFVGDFTDCCLAMNSGEAPQAMVERLIDEAMNVIEVLDDKGATMACAWLYLSEDGSLVIQNMEIAAEFERDQKLKDNVAKYLIDYTLQFKRFINARRLLIGMPGTPVHGKYYEPGQYIREKYVNQYLYRGQGFAMGKLGGYLNAVEYYLTSARGMFCVPVSDTSARRPSSPAILPAQIPAVQHDINELARHNDVLPAADQLSDDQIARLSAKNIARRERWVSLLPWFARMHPRGARSGAALVTASFWGAALAVGALALGAAHAFMAPGIGLIAALAAGAAAGFAVREAVHVNIDLNFIRETDLVRALRDWGGLDISGDTLSTTVWMTKEGLLDSFSDAAGVTPVPLGVRVYVNSDDQESHQLYAAVTKEGHVVLGFAERGLDIDAAVVTREISRALVARDGVEGNPVLIDRMRELISTAAEEKGLSVPSPDNMVFAQTLLIDFESEEEKVSFREGVMVVPRMELPTDPVAARKVVESLHGVNVTMGKHVALDARGFASENIDELIRQTGMASLILTKEQIDTIGAQRLAGLAAAGKYIYVSGDDYTGDVSLSDYVKNMSLAGHIKTDDGIMRLHPADVAKDKTQKCSVLTGTVEQVTEALQQKAGRDPAAVVVIPLDTVLAQEGRGGILQLPALMDALRQYLFDILEQDAAFKQSMERMLNPRDVEAILRAA